MNVKHRSGLGSAAKRALAAAITICLYARGTLASSVDEVRHAAAQCATAAVEETSQYLTACQQAKRSYDSYVAEIKTIPVDARVQETLIRIVAGEQAQIMHDLSSAEVRAATEQRPASPTVAQATSVPDQAQGSPAYQSGATDRQAWETWFGGLSGDYRRGAEYWAGQRSTPKPGSCSGPGGTNKGDWTAGCVAAQQRLAPSDARRRAEPE